MSAIPSGEQLESAPEQRRSVLGQRKVSNTIALIVGVGAVGLGLVSVSFLVWWVVAYLRAG